MIDIPAALRLLAACAAPAALALLLWMLVRRHLGRQYGLRALLGLLTLLGVLLAGAVWAGPGSMLYGACWAGAAALFAWLASGMLLHAASHVRGR